MQEFRLIQRIYRWNQSMQDEELPEVLSQAIVCPRDKLPLKRKGPFLLCPNGHDYPIVHGVPVLLVAGCEQTIDVANASLAVARRVATGETPEDPLFTATLGINEEERQGVLAEVRQAGASVDPVAKFMIGATNGILYRDLIGKIGEYPIPGLRLSRGVGKQLLDVGCNWGRWSVAAARLGYRAVGLDPSLGAVLAARRITKQLGLEAHFVVGDARANRMPRSTDVIGAPQAMPPGSTVHPTWLFEIHGQALWGFAFQMLLDRPCGTVTRN